MEKLEGKVAVVTGATSGIGRALAVKLGAHGMRLVLHGRSPERTAAVARELDAAFVVGDLVEPSTAERLLQAATERYGRCDVAVNNAGIIEVGPIESIDIAKVCAMVRVNVEAAFRVAYTFVRHFKARGRGDLINISSVMGTKVRETAGAYAGTKHAVEALSEALRLELARTDVRVTCLEPGLVRTGLHRHMAVAPSESMQVPTPLVPEDVADSALYVLMQPRRIRIPRLMILPADNVI